MTVGTTASARVRRVRCAAVLRSALWCVVGGLSGHARSFAAEEVDPLVELRRLSIDGHADRALSRLPGLIAAHPDDPRLPFERALLLSSQGRVAEALAVYERMVKTWPELPEPLNNLGVLYAATGELDKARAAFESALNSQQAARTAYANLGDVNIRLAGRAYARALRIDDGPKVLALAPIQRLPDAARPVAAAGSAIASEAPSASLPGTTPQVLAALSGRRDPTSAIPTVVAPTLPSPPSPPVRAVPAVPPSAPLHDTAKPASAPRTVVPSTASVAPASVPATANSKPTTAPPEPGPAARDVQAAIAAWASAWSQKNVDAYFAAYAPGYKGSEPSAAAWQAARRVRILGKSRISVSVSRVATAVAKDGSVAASFRQTYVADQLNVSSSKTLEFVRQGEKWLIRRELAGS